MLLLLYHCSTIEACRLQQPVLDAEKLTKHSFTTLGIVVSLGTFGTKLVSPMLIFSLLKMLMFGSILPQLALAVQFSWLVFGGVWRYCNLMCLNNESWSLFRITNNIHNSEEAIRTSFQRDGRIAHLERFVKWNCNNHMGSILNVDGSCLGTPIRAGFGGVI
jgi:hypothetical protein